MSIAPIYVFEEKVGVDDDANPLSVCMCVPTYRIDNSFFLSIVLPVKLGTILARKP